MLIFKQLQPTHGPAGPMPRNSVQDRLQIARQTQNVQQTMLQRQQHHQQQYQQSWQQQQSGIQQHFQQQHFSDMSYQAMPYHQPAYEYPYIQNYGQFDGGAGNYIDRHAARVSYREH